MYRAKAKRPYTKPGLVWSSQSGWDYQFGNYYKLDERTRLIHRSRIMSYRKYLDYDDYFNDEINRIRDEKEYNRPCNKVKRLFDNVFKFLR